jgi:cell division protein FtsW
MAELAKLVALVTAAVALALALGFGRSQTAGGRFDKFVESWQTTPDKPLSQLTDTEHAMVAIYDGGVVGVGAGRSVMRAKITHPESDYIFAFFVEEYGIFMAIFLVVIYLWIFARAVHIFRQCRWLFCGFLVLGMALIITGQAMLHFLVSINFFFETGQNLPIISHGGTSMICMSIALGIILSISRQIEQGTLVPPEGYASMTPSDGEENLQ